MAMNVTGLDFGPIKRPTQQPAIVTNQTPDVYVNSINPGAPSTLIVSYSQPSEDSTEKVLLDLVRAKGLAMINQQDQPQPQAQAGEDWMSKITTKFESILKDRKKEAQAREEQIKEERSQRLRKIQDTIDEFRKKRESAQTAPGTTPEKTDLTMLQGQNDLKNVESKLPIDNSTGPVATVGTVSPDPSPPPADVLNPGVSIQPDPPPTPHPANTQSLAPSTQPQGSKSESPQDINSNKHSESTGRQAPDNQQNSAVPNVLAEQSPLVGAQPPIIGTVPLGPTESTTPSSTFHDDSGSGREKCTIGNNSGDSEPTFIPTKQPAPDTISEMSMGRVNVNAGTDWWDYWWVPVLGVGGVLISYGIYRTVKKRTQNPKTKSTQPPSNANAEGYARVNNPHDTAVF